MRISLLKECKVSHLYSVGGVINLEIFLFKLLIARKQVGYLSQISWKIWLCHLSLIQIVSMSYSDYLHDSLRLSLRGYRDYLNELFPLSEQVVQIRGMKQRL